MDLKSTVRAIPDYPKPGIVFRDVTTLMGDPAAFRHAVELLSEAFKAHRIDKVAGIEARGFIFGAAVADRLQAGFVPVRKAGKLPHDTLQRSYELEYGEDTLEVHRDGVSAGDRVLLIDDLLATGGTAQAAYHLLKDAGAHVVAAAFVVELPALNGRQKLQHDDIEVLSIISFEGH
ncbi:adenine phosphoribosyltransferase [Parvularcula sp. LCG005]|uniref:adenine phosphoribosyltransferase n=1 Tax=Parvularcula sp. LCG005 TaxID=3078805 RepID=UPI0029427782|nr:adenine phosphoribosyltransferase [Parvularcula sp. LCG005]WOI54022.1 adenine phosphoribosyltransferase [Parvularcula sp. LCG005]